VSAADAVRRLHELRLELERVDARLLDLIVERSRLARAAGEAKRSAGLPLSDPIREARVVETAAERAREERLPEQEVRQMMRSVIAIARAVQGEGQGVESIVGPADA
jgi:chorismate mutase